MSRLRDPFHRLRLVSDQLPHLHLWITLLLGLIFASIFGLEARRSVSEKRSELLSDVETAQEEVQTRLRDTNDYFTLLGEDLLAENLSENAFLSRAQHFIDNHPEITAIGWISEEDGVNWIASRAVHSFDLGLQREEFKIAAGRARDQGDYAFSNFFRTFRGEKSFAVFVPIYKEDSFLGSFFGIYSLDRMVHSSVPSWIDERYDISFVDKDHTTLAREPAMKQLDEDLAGTSDIITDGFPVKIRLVLYQQRFDWQSLLLLALSLGVVIGVGFAIRALNRDRRLKKELAEQMRIARDLAESANQTKSEFVANISHELRTPLTAILAYADLCLRQADQPQETQSYCQHIVRNGHHLLMLINDLLDHSKLEAGYLDIHPELFDLKEVLCEILRAAEPQARVKHISLKVITPGPLPRFVHSDPLRFKQVVANLLSNALKFTDRGQVALELKYMAAKAELLELRVIDSGIGIASQHQEKIFQAFSQADASISRLFGGTGLGLALAKKLAHLLGGELLLERSVPGEGSCFLLRLPLRCQDHLPHPDLSRATFLLSESELESPALQPMPHLARLDGKRILLVEDSPDLQALLQIYLTRVGAQVMVVSDGESAIQLFLEFQRFDAVLMDIQLPGVDGYATTEAIRRLGLRDLPILALTAHAGEEERDKCLEAGFSHFLPEPFDPSVLLALLQELLTNKPFSFPTEASSFSYSEPFPSEDPQLQFIRCHFIRGLPDRLTQMQGAWHEHQWDKLARLAHTLKGTAAHFGLPQLSAAALELEMLLMGQDKKNCSSALLTIKTLTDDLTRGLA